MIHRLHPLLSRPRTLLIATLLFALLIGLFLIPPVNRWLRCLPVRLGPHQSTITTANIACIESAWQAKLPDPVENPPVVAQGVIYVNTNPYSTPMTLDAFNASTGQLLWNTQTDGISAPIVADGTVYVTQRLALLALDAATGKSRWSVDTGGYPFPTLANNVLYIATPQNLISHNTLLAVETQTGRLLWKTDLTIEGIKTDYLSHPLVGNGLAYLNMQIRNNDTTLFSLAAFHITTGKLAWSRPIQRIPQFLPSNGFPLVLAGNVLYANTYSQLTALNALDGTILWKTGSEAFLNPTGGFATPVVAHGMVYIGPGASGSSDVSAFNATTGALRWSAHLTENLYLESVPVVANGRIYLATVSNTGQFVALDAQTGKQIWSTSISNPLCASRLTLMNGILTCAEGAFDEQTGKELLKWSDVIPSYAENEFSFPLIVNAMLYVVSRDSLKLSAFRLL